MSRRGDITYYDLERGVAASGRRYSNSDRVAAVSGSHFTTANPNNNPICGRRVRIRDRETGRETTATVVDKCEGCGPNDVDLSPSAFQDLRPLGVGRFQADWSFE